MSAYDVIVVGGGHAGVEAAAAAARLGRRVALCTHARAAIGRLSCNPAIGGLGKGHLVRELDALGGLMGRVADATCIQFRRLNTRKGLAVQSSRAQVDVHAWPEEVARQLAAISGLEVVEGEVVDVRTAAGRVAGVTLADGLELRAPAVILTTGTFLGGVMHRGAERTAGGRVGDGAALRLSDSLRDLGLRLMRLKTGTVPRLAAASIDWHRLQRQDDTFVDGRFSFADVARQLPPLDCWQTWTNARTHDIIRASLDQSPLFTGAIEGRGPRYCPSIEDKVTRFAERERHLLFLEPEGHRTDRVYVNGISTSLPAEAQLAFVRSVEGLERAEILQYGYAVEYDAADPTDLGPGLQHRGVPGLFLAGQINGTSGYEEAAVQGFVAGVSAARGEPLQIARSDAYLGVLLDDLTTVGIGGEPYRMLTSRAEHRLHLREDNADRRLMPLGRALGLIGDADWAAFERRAEDRARGLAALGARPTPSPALDAAAAELGTAPVSRQHTAADLLRRPELDWAKVSRLVPTLPDLPADVAEQVEIDTKYAGYIDRAERRVEAAARAESARLPDDVDWAAVPSLSAEVRERLSRARPATVGALARLPGVTPAAVGVIVTWLHAERARARQAAR